MEETPSARQGQIVPPSPPAVATSVGANDLEHRFESSEQHAHFADPDARGLPWYPMDAQPVGIRDDDDAVGLALTVEPMADAEGKGRSSLVQRLEFAATAFLVPLPHDPAGGTMILAVPTNHPRQAKFSFPLPIADQRQLPRIPAATQPLGAWYRQIPTSHCLFLRMNGRQSRKPALQGIQLPLVKTMVVLPMGGDPASLAHRRIDCGARPPTGNYTKQDGESPRWLLCSQRRRYCTPAQWQWNHPRIQRPCLIRRQLPGGCCA